MYFDDFTKDFRGESRGRTITEADVVFFSTLTGAYNSLFLDEEYSRSTQFAGRIVPGYLTASIVTGLVYQLPGAPFEGGFVALLGSSFKAIKSIRIGDTIRCVTTLKEKREREKDGLVTLRSEVFNQKGEKVMEVEHTFLSKKR